MSDNVKLTFAATNAVPPIVPLCSRKQGAQSVAIETDAENILLELARVKAVFQLRAICAAMGVNDA